MHIGILTGGGDVPGLNACIKAVVDRAKALGWKVTGFRRGWAGILNYDPSNTKPQPRWVETLTRASVRTIDRAGGTYLHTSRVHPAHMPTADLPPSIRAGETTASGAATVDCTAHVLRVLEKLGIDALMPIGGDGTLSYAARLAQEGVPVVSIPKTMDNDVYGTDYCIGFSTAVTRSVISIDALRTTTGSHERIAVVELFGRRSGETALFAGYLGNVSRTIISEVPFDMERLAAYLRADRRRNPSGYAMVVVSEGAYPLGGKALERGEDEVGRARLGGIGPYISAQLQALTGIGTISQQIAYLMRAGAPDSLDRMVSISCGNLAVEQIERGHTGCMIALRNGVYTTVPADLCIERVKQVDVEALYDREEYRPRVQQMLGKPMFLY